MVVFNPLVHVCTGLASGGRPEYLRPVAHASILCFHSSAYCYARLVYSEAKPLSAVSRVRPLRGADLMWLAQPQTTRSGPDFILHRPHHFLCGCVWPGG